jgi:hypothetical protein
MKLAEALILRSDTQKRYNATLARAKAVARYQEGETPQEDANRLIDVANNMLLELETLIRRINLTNASAFISDGQTLTAAIASRDVLKYRRSLIDSVADAAVGKGESSRQIRSELRYVTDVPVSELRQRSDDLAKQLRELDTQIQQANWSVDLVED